ncbi:c-type cytochrome [Arcobacter vandammei]|uniref:c-type cytochrome n=1 Tax=Arcobacter vandammei TaxID=2782243 RepID=UPI0018DFD824|nr:c-type cytochrome [Arcobacter vandammei]
MKKSLIVASVALALLTGCTDDNKKTETKSAVEQVKQEVAKVVEQKNEDVKVEAPKTEEVAKNVVENEVNAEALFKTCTSCHGQKGEKEALGKSQVIAGWDKDRVIKALNGYKDGSYGGVMKGIMKTHVETKTPEQISALAEFISKL